MPADENCRALVSNNLERFQATIQESYLISTKNCETGVIVTQCEKTGRERKKAGNPTTVPEALRISVCMITSNTESPYVEERV